ncbi:Pyridoxine/pyridoxamine 5'-phosphate oxidase 2 [Acorus calamus]|uniref:Pyridoxine/pyridoxamine 5'-phosphate oxidase 2 n=1 Tax=Acorus calamus TaxID=4465 RepID=A0AAV9FH18_ACOCL|nr:Pyridoxine/pyridoxamine 5'-phosphate oxidase 2 [Acorus calamus]
MEAAPPCRFRFKRPSQALSLLPTRDFKRALKRFKLTPTPEAPRYAWYFTDSWEQFRINGKIDLIDASNSDPVKLQQREKAWFASSLRSRLQYTGSTPGLPCISEEPCKECHLDPSAGPVSAFCVLVMDPNQLFEKEIRYKDDKYSICV